MGDAGEIWVNATYTGSRVNVLVSAIKLALRLILIIGLPVFVAAATYRFMKEAFVEPLSQQASELVLIEVAPGESFKQLCSTLEQRSIVRYAWALDLMARLKGSDKKINAGEYQLSASMQPAEILRKLVSGDVFKRTVTVREGKSIWDVAPLLAEAGLYSDAFTADDFNAALTDKTLLARFGILADSFEGYLFPETYTFSRPIDAKAIVAAMLKEGERNWSAEWSDMLDKLKLSRHEVLTLASIIEKESGNVDEQPIISSVFHNRLRQGMRLQSDPTVIYGVPNFDGNLTKEHLETPGPYNTYLNHGLPPGPIANPGRTAIEAAIKPAETQYLFFVGDGNGRHVFSTTLQEHNEAVRKYQLRK